MTAPPPPHPQGRGDRFRGRGACSRRRGDPDVLPHPEASAWTGDPPPRLGLRTLPSPDRRGPVSSGAQRPISLPGAARVPCCTTVKPLARPEWGRAGRGRCTRPRRPNEMSPNPARRTPFSRGGLRGPGLARALPCTGSAAAASAGRLPPPADSGPLSPRAAPGGQALSPTLRGT